MMVKNAWYIFTLLIACSFVLNANESVTDDRGVVYYNLNIHRGRMAPHVALQAALKQDKISGVDLNVIFLNPNEASLKSSVASVGYFLSNLGNNEIYGHVHAAYFSMHFPLLTNNYPVQLKLGMGPGYVTKKHDPENNHLNMAVGSHLNVYGQISLTGGIPVFKDRLFLRIGMSFNHISNGLVVAPNQGINTLTIHTGLDLSSDQRHSGTLSVGRDKEKKEKNCFTITYASGIKEVDRVAGKRIFTSSLIFDYGYRILPGFNAGVGINIFYNDTWAYDPYMTPGIDEPPAPIQSAIHLVLELEKKPVAIILNPGFYIYKPTGDIPDFTGRLGARYSLRNNLTLMFAVKHHWFALADYFEWGIGYRFFR